MELVLMFSQTQKTEVRCDTVADSRKSSKICHGNMNIFATSVDLREWKKSM